MNVPTIEPGVYRHYKNKLYKVLGVALHSETGEPVVVYRPLYLSEAEFWVRPYDMFIDSVEIDNQTVARFKKIAD